MDRTVPTSPLFPTSIPTQTAFYLVSLAPQATLAVSSSPSFSAITEQTMARCFGSLVLSWLVLMLRFHGYVLCQKASWVGVKSTVLLYEISFPDYIEYYMFIYVGHDCA